MKTYNITFSVPDDFNPEKLELNVNYPDEDVEIISEGFYNFDTINELVKKINALNMSVTSSSVVLFRYPEELTAVPWIIQSLKESLEKQLGCTVIGLVGNIDLLIKNSVEATKMLQQMINTINSKAIIQLV